MALINCTECKQISDRATSCPKCGPIAKPEAITIQETSKKLKLQTLMSACLIIIGVIITVCINRNSYEPAVIPSLIVLSGFFWFITNRIRIW